MSKNILEMKHTNTMGVITDSIRDLAILTEAQIVTNNKKLQTKDIMKWSNNKIKPEKGETVYYLTTMNVYIAIKE